jgi:MYXO-CTERM domain-containing protein
MRTTTWARWSGPMAALFLVGTWSASATAHIHLLSPPARYPMDAQKDAPCGADPASPPGVVGGVTVYEAGETITLTIDEFVGHTGSLRVAIDPTGTDAFALPASYDDLSGPNILASFDDASGAIEHQLEVTLPSEPCDPCTLQVIQIMEDGNFSADDFYFQCADIVIEAAGGGTDGSDSGPSDDTAGPADTSASASAGDDGADDGAGTAGTGGGDGAGDDGPADGADDGADDAADDGGSGGGGSAATDVDTSASDDDSGGCSCSATPGPSAFTWALGLFGLVLVRRRP